MSQRLCRNCQQPLEQNLSSCRFCGSPVELSVDTNSMSNNSISSQSKQINKTLRYSIMFGWFFTLFVCISTTGLVTYFKVIKVRLVSTPVTSPTPIISPIASPTPVEDSNTLIAKAKVELQSGNTEAAIEKLSQAVKIDSNNPLVYETYADALAVANRYQEAIENYQKSIDLNKDNFEPYRKLGQVSEQIGQDDKAIATYVSALSIKNDLGLRLLLARVYVRNNRLDEARKNYDVVVKGDDPALATTAKQEIAKLLEERIASSKPIKTPLPKIEIKPTPTPTPTPTPEPTKKIEPIKIETPKPIPTPIEPTLKASDYLDRGIKLLGVKDYNAALRDFEKVAKLDPSNLGINYLIGQCLYGLGNPSAALNSFRKCTPPIWNGTYSGACQGQVKKLEKELKK